MVYEFCPQLKENLLWLLQCTDVATGGWFVPGLLMLVWVGVGWGMFMAQRNELSQTDFPVSIATAGIVTFVIATLGFVAKDPQLVNGPVFGITFAPLIIGILWLLFTENK